MKNNFAVVILSITISALAFENAGGSQTASDPPEKVSFPTQDGGLIHANLSGGSPIPSAEWRKDRVGRRGKFWRLGCGRCGG
jgi:hypothetical protein